MKKRKLRPNQLRLLEHLARYQTLAYPDCLTLLAVGGTWDRTALPYAFRPLTRHGYAVKRKDGFVDILAKGRALFPGVVPLVTLGGGDSGRRRVGEVSRMAMWLGLAGYPSAAAIEETDEACFIPSACWRRIRPGILSTTRFLGVLLTGHLRLAVYDIGDGQMEWQLRAERSLFYTRYGEDYETAATGMLLVCNDGQREAAGQAIIRQTMWQRRRLLGEGVCAQRERPVRYVRAPIRLAAHYGHVYLTTLATLTRDIAAVEDEEALVRRLQGSVPEEQGGISGDFTRPAEGAEGHCRFFVNPATDLLKYVCFFAAAKSHKALQENPNVPFVPPMQYAVVLPRRDFTFLRMYPDVVEMEEVNILALPERYAGRDDPAGA